MELEQLTQVTASPTDEAVSSSPAVETVPVIEGPTPSADEKENQEIAAAEAAVEQATDPEAKERAKEGYQRRVDARTHRQTKERVRELEIQVAQETARREVYERLGVRQETQPVQEAPQIPGPQLPAAPTREAFTKDVDGYAEFDQVAYAVAMAKHEVTCEFLNRDHQQHLERIQAENQQKAQEGQTFVSEIVQAHPEFDSLSRQYPPSPAVGEAVGILANINRKMAIEAAYYLVKNPEELRRLNALHPEAAKIAVGQLAERLSLPPAKPNLVSAAPNPTQPVKTTETQTTFDPNKASMEEIGRQHPATANLPWLR